MKSDKNGGHKPFEDLKALIDSQGFKLTDHTQEPPKSKSFPISKTDKAVDDMDDPELLFTKAMSDVTPISREDCFDRRFVGKNDRSYKKDDDQEALHSLKQLIQCGDGFNVSATPEYIEGLGYNTPPEVAKRLHQGVYSIQAHIDLHHFNVPAANDAFDDFIKQSIMTGKRAILIVHGRGLSSPVKPVLKTKVFEWLTSGKWRKWVIAFTSARSCDGGAGATYVLLRRFPATKRYRKIKSKMEE